MSPLSELMHVPSGLCELHSIRTPELRELVNKSLTKPDVIATQYTVSHRRAPRLPVDNLGLEIDSRGTAIIGDIVMGMFTPGCR